jgi:hypothetical protein
MKGASLLRINYDREETDSDGEGLRYFLAVEENKCQLEEDLELIK